MDDKIMYGIIGLALLIIISSISQLRSDIARIKVTLDKIAKQIGVPDTITANIDAELKSLISEGKKIKAIKKYRIITGLGLKEAKEYVDLLSEQKLK
ncbi:MAG TPA: ribosomal protein L7/L12 [Clostridium sp.]